MPKPIECAALPQSSSSRGSLEEAVCRAVVPAKAAQPYAELQVDVPAHAAPESGQVTPPAPHTLDEASIDRQIAVLDHRLQKKSWDEAAMLEIAHDVVNQIIAVKSPRLACESLQILQNYAGNHCTLISLQVIEVARPRLAALRALCRSAGLDDSAWTRCLETR